MTLPDDLRARLDSLPDVNAPRARKWTPEEDAVLLAYWPRKNHKDIADILGVAYNTALQRYRELTRK